MVEEIRALFERCVVGERRVADRAGWGGRVCAAVDRETRTVPWHRAPPRVGTDLSLGAERPRSSSRGSRSLSDARRVLVRTGGAGTGECGNQPGPRGHRTVGNDTAGGNDTADRNNTAGGNDTADRDNTAGRDDPVGRSDGTVGTESVFGAAVGFGV
jgi:hypothetical protein